jgi:hypothetical protein
MRGSATPPQASNDSIPPPDQGEVRWRSPERTFASAHLLRELQQVVTDLALSDQIKLGTK